MGYYNGTIRIYELVSGTEVVTFSGHKSAVTALAYDEQGMQLASGAKVCIGRILVCPFWRIGIWITGYRLPYSVVLGYGYYYLGCC